MSIELRSDFWLLAPGHWFLVTGCSIRDAGSSIFDIKINKQRASKDLARTFNQMLDRIQALITEVLEMTDNIAHDLKSPKSCYARVDIPSFQRMVVNLLDNAFKYTPSGGAITIVLKNNETTVDIFIQDNGIGIAQ
jgi:signal transduction histidine kinase